MLIIAPGQEAQYGYFSIFIYMKVYCVFSLESPHRGDSNEYTQHIILNSKQKESPLIILSLPLGDFSKGLENEFETAVVDEPSVLEPLKFYCNRFSNSSYTEIQARNEVKY